MHLWISFILVFWFKNLCYGDEVWTQEHTFDAIDSEQLPEQNEERQREVLECS
jgi:hypothetical protein